MRKILVIFLLLAFVSPAPGLFAHSGVPGVCTLKDKSCDKHEKSCPLEAHGVTHSTHHAMHDMKTAPMAGKKGAPALKCGCAKRGTGGLVRIQSEPFVTGPAPLPCDTSVTPFIETVSLTDSNPFIAKRTKPPAAQSPN